MGNENSRAERTTRTEYRTEGGIFPVPVQICEDYFFPRLTGDLNGDGRVDLVMFVKEGTRYQLSPSLGEFTRP